MNNGWSIHAQLFDYIVSTIPIGSTILELGSGQGTDALSNYYTMYSIEHDLKFVNKYKSTYIHAPMYGNWYNRTYLEYKLPLQYDVILIDGPIGSESDGRIGFFYNIDLFDINVPMIFDDTHRAGEKYLFERVHQLCNSRRAEIYDRFSVII